MVENGFQVWSLAAALVASPDDLLEAQILRTHPRHPRPTESDALGVGPDDLSFWCRLEFEKYYMRLFILLL